MPKGTAEWFGAQYGSGYIVRKGGGANTFGFATIQRELGSLNEVQRLERDMTRVKGRCICPVNLRSVDSAGASVSAIVSGECSGPLVGAIDLPGQPQSAGE